MDKFYFILVTKAKLVIVKHKNLFFFLNVEIYDDKNMWSSLNSNTNFYKELENLFGIIYTETFNAID